MYVLIYIYGFPEHILIKIGKHANVDVLSYANNIHVQKTPLHIKMNILMNL